MARTTISSPSNRELAEQPSGGRATLDLQVETPIMVAEIAEATAIDYANVAEGAAMVRGAFSKLRCNLQHQRWLEARRLVRIITWKVLFEPQSLVFSATAFSSV